VVNTDKTTHPGYGVCTWPFKKGKRIRSKVWDNTEINEYYDVIGYSGGRVILAQNGSLNHETYSLDAFGTLSNWYYMSPLERQKTGFGKFIHRIESS